MAITRLNVDGKPIAFKEEVTVHTENTNIHVTSEEHSGLQDLLNPFAQFNRTGKINVGSKVTGKRKLVLALAHPNDTPARSAGLSQCHIIYLLKEL